MIEDLGSSNGTRVNGMRVREATALRPGDQIELGDTTLELVAAGGQPSANPTPSVDRGARTTAIPLMGGSAETLGAVE